MPQIGFVPEYHSTDEIGNPVNMLMRHIQCLQYINEAYISYGSQKDIYSWQCLFNAVSHSSFHDPVNGH